METEFDGKDLNRLKQVMDDLDALNRCLHEQGEGVVGGPLHVVVDDGNLSDSHVVSCLTAVECEHDVVVRLLCQEIFHLLCSLTEPQRLVWWLKNRIEDLGIDAAKLAMQVRDGVVDPQTNGAYDATITSGEKVLWEGLEQLEALWHLKQREID
jgi:hypothetical protein